MDELQTILLNNKISQLNTTIEHYVEEILDPDNLIEVTAETYPELYANIGTLREKSQELYPDQPLPKVFFIKDDLINDQLFLNGINYTVDGTEQAEIIALWPDVEKLPVSQQTALIAHEFAHSIGDHSQQLYPQYMVNKLFGEKYPSSRQLADYKEFNKKVYENEIEADHIAATLLTDKQDLINLFNMIESLPGQTETKAGPHSLEGLALSYMQSHPPTEDRIEAIEQFDVTEHDVHDLITPLQTTSIHTAHLEEPPASHGK